MIIYLLEFSSEYSVYFCVPYFQYCTVFWNTNQKEGGKRKKGKPALRWMEGDELELSGMDVKICWTRALARTE